MKKLMLLFILLGSLPVWSQPPSGGNSGGTTVLGHGGGTGVPPAIIIDPNPTTGRFNVYLNDNRQGLKIAGYGIYNYYGELVISKQIQPAASVAVDVSELENDNYFIKVQLNGINQSCNCSVVTEEFIKE